MIQQSPNPAKSTPAAPPTSIRSRLAAGIVRTLIFPLWASREHPHYAEFRTKIEESQFWCDEDLRELQRHRMRSLLAHAKAHCPFYRKRLADAGVHSETPLDSPEWRALPLLTKRDIQDCRAEIEAAGFRECDRYLNQTGGSTGSPLQFYVDRARLSTRMASTHRHNAWAGYRPGDWAAVLWGARLDAPPTGGWQNRLRNGLLYRTVDLNTASVSADDWESYITKIRRFRPRFLVAYARSAAAFAEYVREGGHKDITFQSIITSAEVLTDPHRKIIESTFGGQVFNRYGCREVSVVASECSEGTGLHVNAEALLIEVVPSPSLPAPWGKVVVTDLLNYSMPLIRYEIGDVSRWADGPCPCGRGLPRLAEIQGRTTDFLYFPDGRAVSGPALTLVFADLKTVRQVQFVQPSKAEVRLRVVPGPGYSEKARADLRERLNPYIRGAATLQIEEVAAIATEASGKYRFVMQEHEGPTGGPQ